jgi:hypothetical protein
MSYKLGGYVRTAYCNGMFIGINVLTKIKLFIAFSIVSLNRLNDNSMFTPSPPFEPYQRGVVVKLKDGEMNFKSLLSLPKPPNKLEALSKPSNPFPDILYAYGNGSV